MILAHTLKEITHLNHAQLGRLMETRFVAKSEKFLGMTNGGEFCYSVKFKDNEGTVRPTKVFVTVGKDGYFRATQ